MAAGTPRVHTVFKAGAVSALVVLVVMIVTEYSKEVTKVPRPMQKRNIVLGRAQAVETAPIVSQRLNQSRTTATVSGCEAASLAGRRFLRVGFIDEQLNAAKKSLKELIKFAQGTGRTLVEPFAGGFRPGICISCGMPSAPGYV